MKFLAQLKILESSSSGNYLAADIPYFIANPLLRRLAEKKPATWRYMSRNQQSRDRGRHHMTVLAPGEYKRYFKPIALSSIDVTIVGLGQAFDGLDTAVFAVCKSRGASQIRERLHLAPRDFHITLGFDPRDIHDKHKDQRSIFYWFNNH